MKLTFASIKVLTKTREELREISKETGRKHYTILKDVVKKEWHRVFGAVSNESQ